MDRSGYVYRAATGETFDAIALNVFGNTAFSAEILSVNPKLCEKICFDGGETVYLPFIRDDEEEVTVAPWRR